MGGCEVRVWMGWGTGGLEGEMWPCIRLQAVKDDCATMEGHRAPHTKGILGV